MDSIIIKMLRTYQAEREYICSVVFTEFLGIDYRIDWINDIGTEQVYSIAYQNSLVSFPDVLFLTDQQHWLQPASFPQPPLRHVRIRGNSFAKEIPVLFGTPKAEGNPSVSDIDILGSIFFMITRYEEMNVEKVDSFGRYDHKASILYKENLLNRPLVNEYLEILRNRMREIAPVIRFKEHSYHVSLSHDVDVPFTFNAPLADLFVKTVGDLYYRKSPGLLLKRYYGKIHYLLTKSFDYDPNNNFDFIMDEEERAGLKSLFNFIPIPGNGPYDSSYDLGHPPLERLLRRIFERDFEIGFHPGFSTFKNLDRTRMELAAFNRKLNELGIDPVRRGRQHYLRWANPITWRIWNEIGLKEDGSVGYGVVNGFRTGCCYKYTVFDLERREHLTLVEEPLIFMDINSDVNSPTLLEDIYYFHSTCRSFQGNFTILYHNNYIISARQRKLFREVLNLVK